MGVQIPPCASNVISIGSFSYDSFAKEQATNLRFSDWVPMSFVCEYGILFVHHGGHGTCLVGIQLGLPSLVIPTFAE